MAALFVAGLTLSVDSRVGAQGPAAEPPATPTGLTGAFTHDSVSLSWDDPGDPSITGYQILRRERGVHEVGVFLIHVDDTNSAATSYVDTAVEAEASYVYRVKARNSSGLSERSRFFRADLPAAPDPPAPGRPAPPTHLTAEAAGETQIDLSWTAPEHTNGSAIVGYRIEVSTDRGTSWNDLIADTGSTGATYAHTGLVSGATRHYRVSAINSAGAGAPSNIASATTDDLTPPRFVAGVVGADGDSLELYFNEPLDLDPGRTPRASSFGVTADGAPIAVGAVQVIPGREQSISLIGLSPAIRQGQTVSVSYTDPTGGNDEAAIQDRAGNDAASLTDQPVTNGSTLTGASTRGAPAQDVVTQPATATATAQIGAILAAKAQRTPAQRKVSSELLDAIGSPQLPGGQEGGREQPDASAGWPPQLAEGSRPPPARWWPGSGPQPPAATDGAGEFELVTVDIRADVTPEVLGRIRALGGTVINSVPKYRAIRAQLPLVAVQPLAALSAVQSIRPADEPVTHKDTSEGDAAHQANTARTTHGVTGSGIGIGVIANGVATLAERQASGDLPARVTVLPGQEGEQPFYDEGTAMLEIVHDLAPDAELYFATGFSGQAQFAANIEALCEAGADVIVDDVAYHLEATFQDSIIVQGVNAAVAAGCYYFSAAGNSGNLNDGTSGVWEGDYVAGTPMIVKGSTVGVRHDFGGGKEENAVKGTFSGRAVLQWADPLGASASDYDLFLVNGDGNVLLSSTNTQDGTQDPIETFSWPSFFAFDGARLVIVKVSGADRYLRLQLPGKQLQVATAGATYGHAASENAVGVGQVDARAAGGAGGIFDGTESVRPSSSDGPRRLFYEPDGTPITPGDFSSTGGKVLQKPDLSAASCVTTATPNFSPFCGTSAAAPHAAAIAALMLAAAGGPVHVTPAELRTAMTETTAVLDIEALGVDNDSGAGIVMAPGAIAGVAVAVADRNGAPTVTTTLADRTLAAGSDAVTIDLASIFTDPDSATLTYSVVSSDPDRLGVTLSGTEVTLTPGSPGWSAVWARVTDPGGLGALQTFTVTVTAGTTDYDTDNDRLIEVSTLAQLDAIRYDLNGNGLVDGATWEPYYAAFSMGALEMGCPDRCIGYELAANLDFDTDGSGIADSPDTYWNSGAGWAPIGSEDNPYIAHFWGHNHTLANLFINRPTEDAIGLFGELHYGGRTVLIRDVGLVEVDVTGRDRVGALFGRSAYMTVFRSYATGRVTGRGDKVGGLAGESWGNLIDTYAAVEVSGEEAVGGLVGHHILNRITTSYATGRVSGMYAVGGLVGATSDFFHLIQASYATGDVSGAGARLTPSDSGFIVCGFLGTDDAETGSGGGIGGLVGHSCGRIEASYATGRVSGDEAVGGLLGSGLHGSIGFSYWDMETSGLRVGVGEDDTNDNGVVDGAELYRVGPVGMTTAALQEPTDYDGIYSAWAVDLGGPGFEDGQPDEPWDFGTATQYPALSVDLNGDARATWQEFGYQFRSALALAATTTSGQAQVDLSWAAADVSPWTPPPSVTYTVYRDDGSTVVAVAEDLTGTVYADTAVASRARYSYQVAAVVGGGEVVRSARAPVTAGVANQPPVAAGILADRTLLLGAAAATEDVAAAFRDSDGDTLTHAAASSAPSVASVSVSGSEVAITPETGGRAIITVTATDSVGSNPSATQRFSVSVGNDYDSDDDRLIEIRTLAQLDAMRHNLDGGVIPDDRAAYDLAFPAPIDRMGCGIEGCSGYELMADLDFDTNGSGTADAGDTYWNGGAGWAPIGSPALLSSGAFSTTLDGNDHVIANLFVNGGDYAGLFGALGQSGVIRNLSLTGIDVTGEYSAGGLAGQNAGTVIASHATGTVRGQDLVGGLVGDNYDTGSITRSSSLATATSPPSPPNCPPTCVVVSSELRGAGGLVGLNRAVITSSYATGDVTGYPAGGLVGWNSGGGIIASYATGAVTGTTVGGLVGRTDGPSVFETSYATGRVSGNLDVGGLVGTNASSIVASYSTGPASATYSTGSSVGGLVGANEGGFSRIRESYWDSTTSGIAGGRGRSTAALQGPTGYTGLYGTWNRGGGAWDFGTSAQYPILSVDFDGDGNETWQEFGHQLRAGPELTATGGAGQVVLNWAALDESPWTPPPGITYTLYRDATVVAQNLDALSYQDSGLTGGDYTYQLAAVVNGGEATRSAPVTATVIEVRPNNQPQFPSSETGARSVDENTAAGMNIGTAIAAEDADDDPLTYSIASGANLFGINTATGQLLTKAPLDRETAPSHTITVGVSDGKDANGHVDTAVDHTITVTVTVVDVDEAPDISFVATGGVTVNDNALTVDENYDDTLATFLASDPERKPGLTYEWSVVGTDRLDFTVTDDGVLSFAAIPDHEHPADSGGNNVYNVTVRARDSDGEIGELRVTVTVDPVNEAPAITGDAAIDYAENGTGRVGRYRARDPEGEDVTWLSLRGNDAGFFLFNSGELTFSNAPDFEARSDDTYEVTVRARDEDTNIGELPVTVTVVDVDEAPKVMGPEAVTKAENSGRSVGSYTAADPENKAVTWTTLTGADARHFAFDNGALSFVSKPDFEARPDNTYEVTVRARDEGGKTGELRVTVTVRDVNEVPEFPSTEDGMRSVPENTPNGRTFGDPVAAVAGDNDTLTYSITSGANLFGINTATGQLLTKAPLDRETAPSHTITVGVSDGKDANNMAEDPPVVDDTIFVEIAVVDVDEAPKVMGREAVTKAENSGRSVGRYTATDPEGEDVTWTTLTGADARHFAFDNGALSFVSEPDFEARPDNTYEVTVRARDEGGHIGELRVTVTVRDVNEVPEFPSTEDGMRNVPENTPAGRTFGDPVAAVAGDNDTLTYSITSGADLFGINTATGQLLTKAPLDRETAPSHTIRVGVSDGKDARNMAEDPPVVDDTIFVEIAVVDVDEAPKVMGPEAVPKAENSGRSVGRYTATDPENKAVTWTTLTGADARHFAFDNGALSFVSEPDFEARPDNTYEVTVRARDDSGHIGELRVTVTVLPVNERPTITGDAAPSIEEAGTRFVGTYGATDPESATIAWQPLAGSDADKFEFNTSNGRLAFKAAPDFEDADRGGDNEYDVTLSVSAGGHTITFDVEVTVTNKEEPGMLALPATQPQAEADYTATLSDPDVVQSTTWTWERALNRSGPWTAVSGSADSTTTSVYTPVTDDVGYYLRATAAYTDGHGPNKSLLAVSNNPVRAKPVTNNPPTFTETSPTRSIAENAGANAPVGGRVTATDPDTGDTVRYEFEPVPDLFTIDSNSGQIRVAADESLDHETAPSHIVTVKALDSSNAPATVDVTIEVTDVNEPPDAVADAPDAFDEDTEVTIHVVDNDSDPEQERSELLLTVFNSGPNAPRNGTVTVNEPANAGQNRTITYEPNADYNGADTFIYQVRDTGSPSLSSTASVSIQIDAVNDAPVFPPSETGARSVSESAEAGDNVGAPVTATDVDANDTLTYRLVGANASSFEIDSNGQITVATGVTFDIATQETYIVMVDASDGKGGSATVEVTITVTTGPVGPPIITGGGTGGGGGGGGGPSPSVVDFEWTVERDIDELDGGHDKPSGLWSDGTTLWILENGDGADDAIYAYDIETGERVEEREFELDERNRAPRGVWSDRATIWVSDSGQDRLFAHDLESGERVEEREIELDTRNRDPRGIWSDDETIWVLDGGKNALFAYDLATGELIAEHALDSSNDDPRGLWSDGVTLWVSDHGAKRLFAYRIPQDAETASADEDDAAEEEDLGLERVIDEEFKDLPKASNNSPRGIWSDGDVMYVADESDAKVYTYNLPDAIDARLASLTLSGVEFGEFDPARTDYEGSVAEGLTETVVTAEAMQRRTDVDIEPPDADEEADGHQVVLQDLGEITVTVTSADGNRRRVYVVRLGGPEREAPSDPTPRCFRGDVVEGFSLLIYEGGSLENLVVCAASRHVVALYVLDHGVYVSYIVGAPGFVNTSFHELYPDGVLPLTPLVAGSDGPPSGGHVVDGLAEDEPATLRGSSCLYGEIATGFSLAIFEGGSVEELEACGRGFGIAAFYALHEGDWVSFILGAPGFVNRPFFELYDDGLPALTPLVAKMDSPPADNADSGDAAEN